MNKALFTRDRLFNLSKINLYTSLIICIVVLCILVSAFLSEMKFESAVEVVLGLIIGYFVFNAVILHTEQHELIDTTNENFKNLIEHVGVMIIIKSPEEYYRKLKSSIEGAHDSVRLLYLTQSSPTTIGRNSQVYWDWFQDHIANKSNNVVFKRIASLDSKEKIEWLIDKTIELAESSNYGIRVFNASKMLPLIGMEIIDSREVYLFGPHGKTPRWIYINNPDVASGMAAYFEELWSRMAGCELKALGTIVTKDNIEQSIKKCLAEDANA